MILRELHSTGTRDIPTASYDIGYNKNHCANKRQIHKITEKNATMNSTGEQTKKGFLGQAALAVALKDSGSVSYLVDVRYREICSES